MDSLVGTEYLPNAHIEEVTLQEFPGVYRIVASFSMYDFLERTWSLDEKFTRFIAIKAAISKLPTEIDSLTNGSITINDLTTNFQVASFDEMSKNVVTIRGKEYNKFQKKLFFETSTLNTSFDALRYLSIFCTSFIDVEFLKITEGLEVSFADNNYLGSLKSEKLIENGQLVTDLKFFTSDGEPWAGPVHRHRLENSSATIYMGGSQHQTRPHPRLQINNAENQKVTYTVSSVGPLLSAELPRLSERLWNERTRTPRMPSVFQEEFVEDFTGGISSVSIINIEDIMINESIASSLMSKYNNRLFKELIENTNIGNIEINRFPISRPAARRFNRLGSLINPINLAEPFLIGRSNNNNRKVKEKVLYKVSPRQIISVDKKQIQEDKPNVVFDGNTITRSLLKTAQPIGKIEQLNLSLPKFLRPISFEDYDIKTIKSGKYRYQISLSMKDEAFLYCKNLLKEALRNLRKLQNLYDVIIAKNVFNGDHFKNSFVQEFYSQYNIIVNDDGLVVGEFNTPSLQASYLTKAFNVLYEMETLVGIKRPQASMMKHSVNMFSTTPEKIQNTIENYSKIINQFKILYKLTNDTGFEKSSPKKRKDRGVIQKNLLLPKTFEKKLFKPIGINFIDLEKTEGMSRINLNMFKKRADTEVKKFFPSLINKESSEVKSLPSNIRDMFADLEEDKYKSFSPAKIFFGTKEVDTTEINPESFDADFFNTLRVTTAAILNNEETSEQEEIGSTAEEVDSYIDSREYLGNTSKFNDTLISVLMKKPLKVAKLRKKFKFMDSKILKAQRKNISLKTFDITRPDSIVASVAKKKPSDVPLQIKALSLLKTEMTNFDMKSIEFDPVSNPQTQEVFSQNYLNVGKIMMLEGFESINGRLAMNKPIYKEIEPKMLNNLKEKNVLCKIMPQAFHGLTIDPSPYKIHDNIFMLESTERDQMNVQQLSGGGQPVSMPEQADSDGAPEGSPSLEQLEIPENTSTEAYPTISPAEVSSTIPVQNPNNSAIVSVFRLIDTEPPPLEMVSEPVAPSPVAPTTPPGVVY